MASRITRAALGAAAAPSAHNGSPQTQPAGHPERRVPAAQRPEVPTDDGPVAQDVPPMPTGQVAPAADVPPTAEGDEPAAPAVQYVGDKTTARTLPEPIDLTIYPAGSDTEDPSRGQPRLHVQPGKEITGGFGDMAALQYFALDGRELGVLVIDMLESLSQRIVNDLRFNEAITYPRVSVRTWIEVTGFAEDQSFTVDKIVPDAIALAGAAAGDPTIRTLTAEIAREVANEVVFVLVAEKREADDQGDPVDPPDKIRQELGLARPRKQMIRGPGNSTQMVDKLA